MHQTGVGVRMFQPVPAESRYRLLSSLTVDGVPFNELQPEFLNDPRFDPRYTDRFAELNIALFTLAATGQEGARITREPRLAQASYIPDFLLQLRDGTQAYLEVASVVSASSARYNDALSELNAQVSLMVAKDQVLQEKIDGTFSELMLPQAPEASAFRAMTKEIRHLLLTERLSTDDTNIGSVDSSYPLLHAAGAQLIKTRARGEVSHFALREPARAIGPYDLVSLTLQILQRKRRALQGVEVRPLWLSLYFAERMAIPETNLRILGQNVPDSIAPFERVFIGDQRQMIEYHLQ